MHYDSPDHRGIDVGLIYDKKVFTPENSNSHRLLLEGVDGRRIYTRDQLVVSGEIDDETFCFIVLHYPSRRGGKTKSEPKRIAAAKLTRHIADSVYRRNPETKIVIMGDLNDNPNNQSLKRLVLPNMEKDTTRLQLANLSESLFKRGVGSLAYRDKWFLYDQFVVSANLTNKESDDYRYWKTGVYQEDFLINQKGKYKGYPYRTYGGKNYLGGYSDHFPVYLYLVRKEE